MNDTKMKLFVTGHCDSRGPGSWPYHLQKMLDCDIVNFSLAGAAGAYVLETTMNELSTNSYDLAIITWAPSIFYSVKVNDISKFSDSVYTSLHESAQNDWQEKIIYPFNDQDLVEKNWIFLPLTKRIEAECSVTQFAKIWCGAVKYKQQLESDLIRMISLQSWFKCRGQSYIFLHGDLPGRSLPDSEWAQFTHLYDQIDWSNWYTETTLNDISLTEQKERRPIKMTPTQIEVHKQYATLLHSFIKSKKFNQ